MSLRKLVFLIRANKIYVGGMFVAFFLVALVFGSLPSGRAQTASSYTNYAAPSALGASAGEPSIGINWNSGNVMFQASLKTLRVTFNDSASPATATWVNKSALDTSLVTLDPILFTDSVTGRTFVAQLAGKAALSAYTDNDGDTSIPTLGFGINSGVDHQTIGAGPYAPGFPATLYPHAVYYASQDIALAETARSDDGGLTFGAAIPMYTLLQCGGLHGHIKVAPDGTVYVPNKSCGGKQGVAVSADNGLTWSVRTVPSSTVGKNDPSVGVGAGNTVYIGYAGADGHARAAVSRDRGVTWTDVQDVGAAFGIQNTVFPAVVAGDDDRAAFAFLGTPTGGDGTGTNTAFTGVWHLYVATTYDGGRTWTTVDATPNNPVQRGVICTNGTTCPSGTRNLLDFMDVTVDLQGRVLVGYADGCITSGCIQGVDKNRDGKVNSLDNDGAALATIARQSGGTDLFATR
ncbi:MAG: glycoside hydrolase [Acidobacteria bacterium]|nr:glycoside hydrolase [Acidobacteriota bacterium]